MEKECECFKKSEYSNNNTFKTQQDAYNYGKIVAELMNEEFCGTHTFCSQKVDGNNFVISVDMTIPTVPGNEPHISCDVGCGSTDNWSLESTDNTNDDSCGYS